MDVHLLSEDLQEDTEDADIGDNCFDCSNTCFVKLFFFFLLVVFFVSKSIFFGLLLLVVRGEGVGEVIALVNENRFCFT